jgi:hypothetical protein
MMPPISFIKRMGKYLVFGGVFLLLIGCSAARAPHVPDQLRVQYPANLPTPVVTNFNESLSCMDDLMLINKVSPIYLVSEGIGNYTSDRSISAGGLDMLITTLSRMSIRSKAVLFVAYGVESQSLLNLQGAHPDSKNFYVPDYFIRGGVTQHNKSMWSGQEGDGLSVSVDTGSLVNHGSFFSILGSEDYGGSNSNGASYGSVTLDMSAGFISTLQMIPGVSSANTLAIKANSSNSHSVDLTLGDVGYSYEMSNNYNRDFNQVYRSLVQVGLIEIIGKIQGIPYWRCLANAGTVEAKDIELREQFIKLQVSDVKSLVRFVQSALSDLLYYTGEINGILDTATRESLSRYQHHMGLLASGTLGYDTFRMINVFTPARDTAYVPWWQTHTVLAKPETKNTTTPTRK